MELERCQGDRLSGPAELCGGSSYIDTLFAVAYFGAFFPFTVLKRDTTGMLLFSNRSGIDRDVPHGVALAGSPSG